MLGWIMAGVTVTIALALTFLQGRRLTRVVYHRRLIARLRTAPPLPAPTALPDDLPPAARRYLQRALPTDAPQLSSIELEMEGEIRLDPTRDWIPFTARQIIAPFRGFVWQAEVTGRGMYISGGDHYDNGKAGLSFWLFNLFPVVNAAGPDISRSAAGRLAAESVWLPTALLPSEHVQWEHIDEHTARAVMDLHGDRLPIELTVDDEGIPQQFVMQRWNTGGRDSEPGWQPFGGKFLTMGTYAGLTIPTRLAVGWWFGTPRFEAEGEFLRVHILKASFR
jgi:Family of unknown function (DUF6544)